MWFLVFLTFFTALINHDLVLRHRIHPGGFPVNVFDVLLFVVGPVAVLLSRGRAYPTGRTHPILPWILLLLAAATGIGLVASLMSGTELRDSVTSLRNFIAFPLTVWLGYHLMPQPRSASRICYAHVFTGVATACLVLLYFGSKATVMGSDRNVDVLRAMKYMSSYCGMAAVLVLFSLVSGVRMFPGWLAVLICAFCFIGQFATLSRSDWLAVSAAVVAVYFGLPSARRGRKLAAAVVGPPLAIIFLWVGLVGASVATGTNFTEKMVNRVYSLLPGDTPGIRQKKAWETRWDSTLVELKWWAGSPAIGRGFGYHEKMRPTLTYNEGMGLKHNTFVGVLAETGVVGLAGVVLTIGGAFVVGRRMVRDWNDRGFVLVGALGVVTATMYTVLGLTTMSFNQVRGAIPVGIMCGIVFRCRAMQLAALGYQQQQQQAHGYGDEYYDDAAGYGGVPLPDPAGHAY